MPDPERRSPQFGDPIDFPPATEKRRRWKEANPWIWGAWLGLLGAASGTIAGLAGQLPPGQSITGFGMGGLFWGWVVGNIWNKLGNRAIEGPRRGR